jgi:hypothetical protein
MQTSRLISLTLAVGLALGGATLTTGCREKGPAEKAGEKVDKTMDKIEDKLDPKGTGGEGRTEDRSRDRRREGLVNSRLRLELVEGSVG